ncbi:MAG: hypothetical protein ACK5MA_09100 [Parachlamydiaceae bacterium]
MKGKIKGKLTEASTKLSQIKAKLKDSSAVKKLQEKINKLPMFKKDSELKKTIFKDGPELGHKEEHEEEVLESFDPREPRERSESVYDLMPTEEDSDLEEITKKLGEGTLESEQAESKQEEFGFEEFDLSSKSLDDQDAKAFAEWEEWADKQPTEQPPKTEEKSSQTEMSSRPTRKPPSRVEVLKKQFENQYKDMSWDNLQKRLNELDNNRPPLNTPEHKNWITERNVVITLWRKKM